ncbi:hypothetical protein BDW74DRAFT_184131 [Aspergillus multicolor]|uniref:uncharacterized protein n=1 Tax=Aspergillus multicolor TaxID=41759 RepID=UPI003CCDE76C
MAEELRDIPLIADIAQRLNAAQVASFLFGWWMREHAIRALIDAGFQYCDDPTCSELTHDRYSDNRESQVLYPIHELVADQAPNGWHEIADAHFHLDPRRYAKLRVLSLFKQSRLLWTLPPLSLDPVSANDRTFMLTNDATLTHAALWEAIVRLKCRYLREGAGWWRFAMWDHCLCHTLGKGVGPERRRVLRENLTPQFQAAFDAHYRTPPYAGKVTPRDVMNTLYNQLTEMGEL